MKLSKEELLDKVKAYTGDRTDDETLSLIEDISDSMTVDDSDDWKAKYADLARKYKDRFTEKEEVKDEEEEKDDDDEEEKDDITVDDLFTDEKEGE